MLNIDQELVQHTIDKNAGDLLDDIQSIDKQIYEQIKDISNIIICKIQYCL